MCTIPVEKGVTIDGQSDTCRVYLRVVHLKLGSAREHLHHIIFPPEFLARCSNWATQRC